MSVCVKSEIGKLTRVMLHRPGRELERLVPVEMERMLFDDIPYLRRTQEEHDYFAAVLRENGVRVFYLEDMMADILKDTEIRRRFVRQFIFEAGPASEDFRSGLYDHFMAIEDSHELVQEAISGVDSQAVGGDKFHPLAGMIKSHRVSVPDPMPNLYFTRDPFAVIGCGVSLNRMYSAARRRETIFGQYILEYHPEFAGTARYYYRRELPYCIEGGDILNISSDTVAIGISQRTSPEAIEYLARNIFSDQASGISSIIALDIPSMRAFMHLDTVFTQLDIDKFMVYPGILGNLHCYELTRGGQKEPVMVREVSEPLQELLAKRLRVDTVKFIRCGGDDAIASEREQWNDGSNTLCISPGKVIVYDRNYVTNELLVKNGIEAIEIPSSELSRGRGGPRCMSMPIERLPYEL